MRLRTVLRWAPLRPARRAKSGAVVPSRGPAGASSLSYRKPKPASADGGRSAAELPLGPGSVGGGLLTVEGVCEYLVVSRDYVYDEVKSGRLAACRIARQLRFRPRDVEAFVELHLLTPDGSVPP